MSTTSGPSHVIGISAYYHDSAAALITDGKIVKAAQEERFSRLKNDPSFPVAALRYCLESIDANDIHSFVFYEKPFLKFERLLETYLAFASRGFTQFRQSLPTWIKHKLFIKQTLKQILADLMGISKTDLPPLHFTQHH